MGARSSRRRAAPCRTARRTGGPGSASRSPTRACGTASRPAPRCAAPSPSTAAAEARARRLGASGGSARGRRCESVGAWLRPPPARRRPPFPRRFPRPPPMPSSTSPPTCSCWTWTGR
ncbi:hypothetical protein BF93_18790 [Brachybacterium phenoliresistens]|uniref:Uncharacterized protein n=1 Tax=Brachybacterium phenoliresistens TaxID=396014 RepID=Z9JTU5_9MICO|nr:hypothetical protein BF93_18790 [Brachybacterium phenoliresistens]